MHLLPQRWTLRRLRDRLAKVEREKDLALQSLIVRDQAIGTRPRYDYQDPGVVGSLLDEIAGLQARIALIEHGRHDPVEPPEPPSRPPPALPRMPAPAETLHPVLPPTRLEPRLEPKPDEVVVDAAFHVLRDGLTQMQTANSSGRIGADALREALHAALASEAVLDVAFHALRSEMVRMQRSNASSKIGLDALREALRAALGAEDAGTAAGWNGSWSDMDRPGTPAEAARDGWHWVQAPGKPIVALSWHAETRCWGHRMGISARKLFDDGVQYYGPCAPPVISASAAAETVPA